MALIICHNFYQTIIITKENWMDFNQYLKNCNCGEFQILNKDKVRNLLELKQK